MIDLTREYMSDNDKSFKIEKYSKESNVRIVRPLVRSIPMGSMIRLTNALRVELSLKIVWDVSIFPDEDKVGAVYRLNSISEMKDLETRYIGIPVQMAFNSPDLCSMETNYVHRRVKENLEDAVRSFVG